MSGHTKGPWKLETVKTSSGFCHKIGPFPWKVGRDNHACIYVDYPNGAVGQVELELKANAHLMAAAPELLAACRDWIEWLDSDGEGDFDGAADKEAAMLNAMRAALAKATGASA